MNNRQLQNPYKVSLTIVVGLLLLCIITGKTYWLYLSGAIGVCAVASSKLNAYIALCWMQLAKVLSMVMPKLILGGIYLLFLTPLAYIYKWFGRKSDFKLERNHHTQFTTVDKTFHASAFEKMW